MADWPDKLSSAEQREWDRFVKEAREGLVGKMASSAMVMSLVPTGEPDIKFAVELGMAIMLDKPIVALATRGAPVPGRLRKVADAVVVVSDLDTEWGQRELHEKLTPVLRRLGIATK